MNAKPVWDFRPTAKMQDPKSNPKWYEGSGGGENRRPLLGTARPKLWSGIIGRKLAD